MPAWWTWFTVGDIAVPKLMAQESLALIILMASLLVFRTFRERYLLVWIVGWMAYFGSRWTVRGAGDHVPTYLIAIPTRNSFSRYAFSLRRYWCTRMPVSCCCR